MKHVGSNPDGGERRNGSVKLTGGDYIKIFSTVTCLLVAGTLAWSAMKGKVTENGKGLAMASEDITEIHKVDVKQNDDILMIQSDVRHIKDDVSQMKGHVQSTNDLVQRIAGKMGIE